MEHDRNLLSEVMGKYAQALDELMDAQKYAGLMDAADDEEDKSLYRALAKQELDHQAQICKTAAKHIERAEKSHWIHVVWDHLSHHVKTWRGEIEQRLS